MTILNPTMRIQDATWAEEMDTQDLMLVDDNLSSSAAGSPAAAASCQ